MVEEFVEELEVEGKVKVYFMPDNILPEESKFRFEQKVVEGFFKKRVIEYKAIIKITGDVIENVEFTPTEIHSFKAYIAHNKAKFMQKARRGN